MKQVLIVEDDPTWAMLLDDCVRRLEAEAHVVRSPQQAMDVLDKEAVDLIILDMLLAVETGMALLNEMRGYEDLARIPVLAFSNLEGLDEAQLSSYGVVSVLNKSSVTPEQLQYHLRELLYGRD